jgi:hypothetical protein
MLGPLDRERDGALYDGARDGDTRELPRLIWLDRLTEGADRSTRLELEPINGDDPRPPRDEDELRSTRLDERCGMLGAEREEPPLRSTRLGDDEGKLEPLPERMNGDDPRPLRDDDELRSTRLVEPCGVLGAEREPPLRSTRLGDEDGKLEPLRERMTGEDRPRSPDDDELRSTRLVERCGMLGVDRDELPLRSTRLVPDEGKPDPERDRMIGSEARRSFVGVDRSTRLLERSGRLRVAESVRDRLGVMPPREELRTSSDRPTREGEESDPDDRTLPEEPRAGSPARRQPPSLPLERTLLELERGSEAAGPPRAEDERTDAERSPPRTPAASPPRLERKSRSEVAT